MWRSFQHAPNNYNYGTSLHSSMLKRIFTRRFSWQFSKWLLRLLIFFWDCFFSFFYIKVDFHLTIFRKNLSWEILCQYIFFRLAYFHFLNYSNNHYHDFEFVLVTCQTSCVCDWFKKTFCREWKSKVERSSTLLEEKWLLEKY